MQISPTGPSAAGSGSVDRGEFLKYVLLTMGKVEPEDIDKALLMFDRLDPQRTGVIEVDRVSTQLGLVRSFSSGLSGRIETDVVACVTEGGVSSSLRDSGSARIPSLREPLLTAHR